MQAGNRTYAAEADLPATVPVFPLSGALLLPGGQMPLNIFEPRYIAMIDDLLAGERIVGIIQPRLDGARRADGEPELCALGCLGRLTSVSETGDGRYLVTLHGIARFRVEGEVDRGGQPYRVCRVVPFVGDLDVAAGAAEVDRGELLRAFRLYLEANQLEADWDSVTKSPNETLVNALSMMLPYGPAEKQALLEAEDLKTRAETLVAITEIGLAREGSEDGGAPTLQCAPARRADASRARAAERG